ncbi:unnamed protein product [Arctia plantaginis]|uniref:Uncharacterized protein n=1 Tax=Arctia plantaginis TaxID=874455 RepID=A0A8S0YUH1_ARCPL|nr:unnamed protein product [Arctia plantaginis]CAB3241646.1 unnamed protein product [Arctia plantaginis]
MKVLYFLALVVLCIAAPIDTPPKNLKVTVHQENGIPYFVAKWDKVESSDDDPILGYDVLVNYGKLYVNFETKEDGSKVTEVFAPTKPEKPITKLAEFDVPASSNEYIYKIEKGVVYQVAVRCYTAKGRGPLSEYAMFSFL